MRTRFLPLPLQWLQVLTAEVREKYYSVHVVLLSDRGAWLFRTVFHISIKAARTNYGLKDTYILKRCLFLPAGTADTGSIASLMRI